MLTACAAKLDPSTDPDLNPPVTPTVPKDTLDESDRDTSVYDLVKMRAYDYNFDYMDTMTFAYALGVGWNLGNTFDALGGDGVDPVSQETSWGNPATSKALIQTVADYGFTTIRIPITWYHFMDDEYHIDEAFLERIKQVVDWSLDEGLFVIINTHHEGEWLIPGEGEYEAVSNQLCTMWKQIGEYFADYDERLVFEAMNEPRVGDDWNGNPTTHEVVNKLGVDFVDTIRSLSGYNYKRFLIIPCYAATSNEWVWREFSINDYRVIISIHAYLPYDFALNIAGTSRFKVNNPASVKEIDNLFNNITNIFLENGWACVIGEMGCMSKNDNVDDRIEWAKYYTKEAAFRRVPILWWDNGAFTDGETFGLINRETYQSPYEEIISTMIETWYKTDDYIFDK